MNSVDFSVIIPSYNSNETICRAIDSIFKQSVASLEIIVIDDGSTDGTKKKLDPYIKTDKIRYYSQKNKGQGAARNLGVRHAKCDWIAFLDADDEWLPNYLETQVDQIKKYPNSKLFFTNAAYYERGKFLWNHYPKTNFYSGQVYENLLDNNYVVNSSVVINKTIFNELGGFSESTILREVEDYDLWLRYAIRNTICGCNDVCVKYNLNRQKANEMKHKKHVAKGLTFIMLKQFLFCPLQYKYTVMVKLFKNINVYTSL